MEVRHSVTNDMRLGNLYREFKQSEGVSKVFNNACDMFRRENFSILTKAIDTHTKKLRINESRVEVCSNFYLIKSSVKAMKRTYLIKNEDGHARDIEDFKSVLELCKDNLFADATYHINMGRQVIYTQHKWL